MPIYIHSKRIMEMSWRVFFSFLVGLIVFHIITVVYFLNSSSPILGYFRYNFTINVPGELTAPQLVEYYEVPSMYVEHQAIEYLTKSSSNSNATKINKLGPGTEKDNKSNNNNTFNDVDRDWLEFLLFPMKSSNQAQNDSDGELFEESGKDTFEKNSSRTTSLKSVDLGQL